jgi:hypothetical protein
MALAVGLALNAESPASRPTSTASPKAQPNLFDTRFPSRLDLAATLWPETSDRPGMRVASLDPNVGPAAVAAPAPAPSVSSQLRASFADRFVSDPRMASFDDRFAASGSGSATTVASNAPTGSTTGSSYALSSYQAPGEGTRSVMLAALPPADIAVPTSRSAASPARSVMSAAPSRSISAPDKRVRTADLSKDPIPSSDATKDSTAPSEEDSRTAIYDISAHVVYMPNGDRLEAHSGLGDRMDDIRSINVKREGPTPPNVYKLTMREKLFHGVRAIRLVPVDESKMFGRDGMLAHTYMLGPNGQSNGCVSFNDYEAFLNAFLKGEVDRLVVVERLDAPPGQKTPAAWFADTLKNIFGRS